jgi:hypothetical protein
MNESTLHVSDSSSDLLAVQPAKRGRKSWADSNELSIEILVRPLAPEDPRMKALLEILFPNGDGSVIPA